MIDKSPILILSATAAENEVGLDFYKRLKEIYIRVDEEDIKCIYEFFYMSPSGHKLELGIKAYIIKDINETQHRWTDWVNALGDPIMQGAHYALTTLIPVDAPDNYTI